MTGPTFVHYIPILTTLLALPFAFEILRRYRRHPERLHLLWWGLGVLIYGVGTFTEAATTLAGWSEPVFRAWYISGALLGGAPLAQGTVYLLLRRRTAHLVHLLVDLIARGGGLLVELGRCGTRLVGRALGELTRRL